jgi:dTDP-L-rhamnose 4-epimerase
VSAHVLVTGGAGFVGRAVVPHLLQQGHQVRVLDSLRPDVLGDDAAADAAHRLRDLGAQFSRTDVRDLDAMRIAVQGADAVVHLAAKVGLGVSLDDIDDYASSNDLGTAVVLRACAAAGVARFVLASSMVVYGEGRYTCPAHGDVAPAPRAQADLERGRFDPPCPRCGGPLEPGLVTEDARLDPRSAYAASKVAQEHLTAAWARESAGSAVALRLHNVYGPGMPRNTPYAGVAALFLSALGDGQPPRVYEDGAQRRDFVHVADVARAVGLAVASEPSGHRVVNVGSGTVTTVGDLARALAALRAGPEPVVTGEYRLGDVRHITASSELAATELGFRARIRLADGLADLAG